MTSELLVNLGDETTFFIDPFFFEILFLVYRSTITCYMFLFMPIYIENIAHSIEGLQVI
jgi:hypothetical protein